jgi:acyl-ACP thioesterase
MKKLEIRADAPQIYTETFRIRSYHVDIHQRLTLPKLCSFFQEVAGNHTVACGVGWDVLQRENIFWVLSRLKIEIKRYPVWQEKITIRSWSNGLSGLMAIRHFQVLSEEGEELVRAISSWLTVDTSSRRIVRANRLMDGFPLNEERLFDENPEKLMQPEAEISGEPVPVCFTETDMNQHMNNVSYIDRIINAYPFDFLMEHRVSGFEINFLKEAVPGELLKVQQQSLGELSFLNNIVNADDGSELVRTLMRWSRV